MTAMAARKATPTASDTPVATPLLIIAVTRPTSEVTANWVKKFFQYSP